MLIVSQDGEAAVTLEKSFKIEIGSLYIPVHNKPNSYEYYFWLEQNDRTETWGRFDSFDEAKKAVNDFTAAYDRGDRVFRVP